MQFQEIIGQDTACTQLQRAYANNRLSHAYIFDGPSGVGKRDTALALAALLLCEHPQAQEACGSCSACRLMAHGTHPDCHIIEPDGRTIKIKQIRDLRLTLANTASYGGYTVVIIDQADTMGLEAANAFLKTVEEPQGPTCFILITTRAERLPDTIRSRTQLVHFKSLSHNALAQRLGKVAETQEGQLAIALAAGSYKKAQAYLDDAESRTRLVERREALENLLAHLVTAHDGALLRFAESFNGDREAVREAIFIIRKYCQRILQENLRLGTDLSKPIAFLHHTTDALNRLEYNTEPAFILGALLIELARQSRQ